MKNSHLFNKLKTIFLCSVLASFCFACSTMTIFKIAMSYNLAREDDQEIANTYEKIYQVAQNKYHLKQKPKIQKMRSYYATLAKIPIINGSSNFGAMIAGQFSAKHNLIIIMKHCGTFGREDGVIAHEIGHAVGWNEFCEKYSDCQEKLNEYSDSVWGTETYADKIGIEIADTIIQSHQTKSN